MMNPNDTGFFEILMQDPVKRAFVLQLLSQEKDAIAEYKKNEAQRLQDCSKASSLKRVKQKTTCESPSALMRRRALEKLRNQDTSASISDRSESRTSGTSNPRTTPLSSIQSDSSDLPQDHPSPVPFNNLLKGVVAFVEINSHGTDRSAAVKVLMTSMGAIVRDTFTADVTHVIFRVSIILFTDVMVFCIPTGWEQIRCTLQGSPEL